MSLSRVVLCASVFCATAAVADVVHVSGTLDGVINGEPISAGLNATGDTDTGLLNLDVGPFGSADIGNSLQWCFIHNTGICGAIAVEIGGAVNMQTLTGGSFTRNVFITFFDGRVLNATQTITQLSDAEYEFTSTYDGEIPLIPLGTQFQASNYEDRYTQLNETTVRVFVKREYIADLNDDGVPDEPYYVNAIIDIHYNGDQQLSGEQTLRGSGLESSFDQSTNMLHMSLTNEMAPLCSADYNGDGVVNTLDFVAFLNAWAGGCQ